MSKRPDKWDPLVLALALRERVSLSPAYASELANGKKTPSLETAVRIDRALKIKPQWWLERHSG